ncbi:glycosyltransferase [Priestia aryabhattai]|uniref:glycosyltransferase n=1 Tax=Priestia aryabhattai TaxID=412384 RepID=UPI0012FD36E8|nr:glycosyltransferase [Priestia aryabhattai]
MRKVLFIINNLGGGGAEKVLINILNNIDYTQYQIDLLLLVEEGVYLDKVNKNVNLKTVIPRKKSNKLFHRLYRYCSYKLYKLHPRISASLLIGKKYDLEISFLEGPSTIFLSHSPNKKSKKVAWIHADLVEHRTMSYEKERKIYKVIDEIVCVSHQCKNKILELYPEYNKKLKVIYNLIDKDEILRLSNEKIDFTFDENTIVAVGRLTKVKRFDILIRAHRLLRNEGIKSKLVILGEGELRNELEELVKNLHLEDTVYMPGFVENPYPYIKNGDIFAVSSDHEGFSLVVAEALTLEKAIVSTNCTGPTELLCNGEFGIIISRENEIALKNSLKELLLNKRLREEYERKALKRSEILSKQQVMNLIYKLIDEEKAN